MMRIPEIPFENLSPEQRKVHDAIAAGPRGRVEGPLKVWLHSPLLAARAQELGAFCRYHTSLPKRLSELAILMTGAHWRAGFEWHAHAPAALAAGLDPAAVEAIRTGRRPAFARPDEAAVHDFVRELLDARSVSEAAYRRAHGELGTTGIVELVGILGYYALISMTIVAFRVPVPERAAEPFAE
jgi:4-carboxymuconolactone decarboxylase